MREELKEEIMKWHNKGLSQFGIARKVQIPYWEIQEIIEAELKKDFNSLFKGG